jgi:hypothetical protein
VVLEEGRCNPAEVRKGQFIDEITSEPITFECSVE